MKKLGISVKDALLMGHMLVYGVFGYSVFTSNHNFSQPLMVFIMWTGFALLHFSSYYREKLRETNARENPADVDEHQAYRDGFNDAVRTMRDSQRTETPARLYTSDEMTEDPETGKGKYRSQ